jgi:hypothetical protein
VLVQGSGLEREPSPEIHQACYHQKKLWAPALVLEMGLELLLALDMEIELEMELEMEKKKVQVQGQ